MRLLLLVVKHPAELHQQEGHQAGRQEHADEGKPVLLSLYVVDNAMNGQNLKNRRKISLPTSC